MFSHSRPLASASPTDRSGARLGAVVCGLLGIAITLALFVPIGHVQAQGCMTIDPPCPNEAPVVSIVHSQSSTSQRDVAITVYFSDDDRLNDSSHQVWLNGADVTSQFDFAFDGTNYFVTGTALGTVQLAPSPPTNAIRARICDTASPALCGENTIYLTYTPPPTPPAQAAPALSLAPYSNDARVLAGAAASHAYATPAYQSLDDPRAVGLFYSSEHAKPTGFIQVDATLHTEQVPTRLSIQVRRPGDDAFMTLTNGATEAFFVGDTGTVRLAAQFDAAHLPTGAYMYDLIVKSWWSSGTPVLEDTIQARVLVLNEQASIYGAGWTVAGIDRIHPATDGSGLMVANGAGLLQFFRLISCSPTPDECTYESPAGDFSTMVRHPQNQAWGNTYWTRTGRDGSTAEFYGDGLLRHYRDRFQNETRVEYQSALGGGLRVWRLIDPAGKTTELGYEGSGGTFLAGSLRTITLPDGRQGVFDVNQASGDLQTVRDPDGVNALQATYQSHRLMTWKGRNNGEFALTYDAFGQLSRVETPAVATRDSGSIRLATAIQSVQVTLLPLSGQGTSLSDPDARAATRPDSAWARVTHPNGATTRALAHRSGAPLRVEERDAAGKTLVSTWQYNSSSQVIQHTTPSGGSESLEWSGSRLTKVIDHVAGTTTLLSHNSYDQIERVWVNGVLQVTQYFSGSNLAPDSVRTDTAAVTRYTYDSRGRVLTVRDPESHTVTTVYQTADFENTQSVATSAPGQPTRTTSVAYDGSGRPRQVTDPALRVFVTERDAMNRDTLRVAPQNTRTRFTHDDVAGVYTVVDARTQEYRTTVNALGWTTALRDPRLTSELFAYDKQGNVVTYTNRRGGTVVSTYDALNRVDSVVANGLATRFAYDTAGRWVAVRNAESTDTLFMDASGRPSVAASVRAAQRYETRYAYFANGLPKSTTVEALPGSGVQWVRAVGVGYDAAQRLSQLQDHAGKQTVITYNREELPLRITLPTSTTESQKVQRTLGFTSAHRLETETYNQGLQAALGRGYYLYDALERVGTIQRGAYPDTYYRDVQYDSLGRLKTYTDRRVWYEQIWHCNDPMQIDCPDDGYWEVIPHNDQLRTATYSYDAVGNRTDLGAVTGTGNRLTSFNGYTMTYDDDGFMTAKTKSGVLTQNFTWNDLGQLTQVVTNGVTTTYGYDGWGRRVRKTVSGVATGYIYDGDQVVIELDANRQPVVEYTYYPGIDQPHSMRRGGQTYYYAQDAQGNVTGLIGATGALAATYEHTPFGETISASGTPANVYRFKGREYDAESGLYFMRARYYDPQLGRFNSEDPIGLAGGINSYAFAGNDPVNNIDPYGLTCYGVYRVTWEVTSIGGVEISRREISRALLFTYGDCGGGGGGGGGTEQPPQEKEQKASAQRQCRASGMAMLRGMFTPSAATGAASVAAGKTTEYLASAAGADATRRLANLRAATRIPGRYVTRGLISGAAATAARAGAAASAGTAAVWTGTAVLGLAAGYGIGVDVACRFDSDYYGAD